jgi:hypothetical protein
MKLYRFSPIGDYQHLIDAITNTHFACYELCKNALGYYLPNAGNMGVFCHYEDEYNFLTKLRKKLTEESDNVNQKYYRLHQPIIIPTQGDIPKTTYNYLYIRKPDPYRYQVGDVDFFLEQGKYIELKKMLLNEAVIKGARIFDRSDLDMIELQDPDIDVLGYISTKTMTEKVRAKIQS